LFILPNSTLFEQASREVLAKDPACLERVRILAFDTLVQEILAKAAIERRAMSRMAQECLVKQIIDDLIGEGQLHYFQEMRSFPGFIRTITSLIGEIKRSATSPAEWLAAITAKEGSPETHIKDFELTIIYQKYQQKLDEYKLLDLEESYFLASQALRDQPELFTYEILYFSEFYIFTPLQQELLDVLRQQCELKIALAYEKNRPEIYGPVERTYTFLVGAGFAVEWVDLSSEQNRSDCLNSLIQTLFTEQSIEKVAAPCIELVTAPHEAKELELVGSYIKKQLINGKRPDEIAILIRSDEKYPGLFALCKELSLPLDRRRDEPLMNQPLLKLLFAIIAAHMDGGSKQSVKTLLDSAFIANRYGWDREELLQKAAGVRLYQWQDWLKWLQAYPKERQGFLTLYETIKTLPQRARVKEFGATLSALMIELVPFTSLGRLYREGLPLERFKAAVLSYKAIISGLDTLSEELVAVGQGESSLTLAEYSKLLSQFFSLQNITLEEPFYGGIQVLSPAEARGVTFSTVCLLGLTEGHFPKAVPENWLYNDHERRLWNELGVSLPTAAKRREEEKFYFTVAVALAKERLYVSGIENQETLPSPFLAEIDRLTEIPPKNKRAVAIDEIFPDDYREIYSMKQLQRKAL
ncbi:MAG: 3'-5' exonuclease, partial [Sporomusaceae bacterium]|nr:3'-5' exonuclease [Sporomusaceae bacterium]